MPSTRSAPSGRPGINRRQLLRQLGAASLPCAGLARAQAQEWPAKPLRFIVPTPAGTGPDVDLRQMAGHLGQLLGQQIVVENRPGAATRIAVEAAINAAPDGYTFLVGTPSLVTMTSLYPKLRFDPRTGLVPVSLASLTQYTLTVNASVPARTVAEFAALMKADARYQSLGTLGVGAVSHLTGAWFGTLVGVAPNFIHYATTPPFTDLVSGQYPAIFEAMLPVLPHVQSGRLKSLALSGRERHPLMPDVPTFAEAGYTDFDPLVWIGILAPAATPAPLVQRVSAAVQQVCRLPEIVAARRGVGSRAVGSTAEEFGRFLDAERAKWSKVIAGLGLVLE